VGGEPLWVEPPDAIEKMVPNYSLMWGMFGIARMPENGAVLEGLADDATIAWRYAAAADTVEYVRTQGNPARLVTVVRRAGKLVGRAEAALDSTGAPRTARLTVPTVPARLDLEFLSTARADFAPDIWVPKQP